MKCPKCGNELRIWRTPNDCVYWFCDSCNRGFTEGMVKDKR